MAGVLVEDAVTLERSLLAEKNAAGRFSDANLILWTDRAHKQLVKYLLWPQSRVTFKSLPGIQEYPLIEMVKPLRVYVAGQAIVPTTIDDLEGNPIQFYDQTAQGLGPSGLLPPGEEPSLISSGYAPQWTSAPASVYPVANGGLGAPAPDAQPWFPGQRPRYYFRSGNFGLVPPPAGNYPVVIDCVRQPSTVNSLNDYLLLPDICLDTLAALALQMAFASDRTQSGSSELRQYYQSLYVEYRREAKAWAQGSDGPQRRGPKPITYRSQYSGFGNNRNFNTSRGTA